MSLQNSNPKSADDDDTCALIRTATGPWVFGVGLDILLFGVLTVQTYVYYLAFPKDRRLLKLAVILVYLVGVAQTILAMVDLAMLTRSLLEEIDCTGRGTNHLWLTVVAFGAVAALTAQWLYAHRIYVISHKLWIAILIICLSLGQLGTSVIGCLCMQAPYSISVFDSIRTSICVPGFARVWGPLNILCDTTITVSMSIVLLKRRKGILQKSTHAHITKIIQLVVETGLATSVVVVVYTLTYNLPMRGIYLTISNIPLANPSVTWLIPGLAMGKVYSNSMLALLNNRLIIVGGRNSGDPFDSEIRSEVLRTEVEQYHTTNSIARHSTPNRESSRSA